VYGPDGAMRLRVKPPPTTDLPARLRSAERIVAEQRARLLIQESLLREARDCNARLTATADCSAEAIYSSRDGRITSWNRGAEALYGYSAEQATGEPVEIVYPPGRDDELADIAVRIERGESIAPHRTVRRRKDGSLVQVNLSLSPIRNDEGQICGTAAVGRDLSEADQLLDELRDSESRYRSIVENAQEGIALIGLDGCFTYANRRMGELLGRPVAELTGCNAFGIIDIESATTVYGRLEERRNGKAGHYEVSSECPDGRTVRLLVSAAPQFDPDGGYAGSLCMASDLSALRQAEAQLVQQALHDPLTGLPNRALLHDRIERALARSVIDLHTVVILSFDLDGFKEVNGSFGRRVGDRMLRIVADRLSAEVYPNDTVARLDGDEFIVLTEGVVDETGALDLAARLRAAVSRPMKTDGAETVISCSVGIAIASADDPATLLRHADTAMCRAKEDGRGRSVVFDEQLGDATTERSRLLAELRHAVARNELRLHYQPIVALDGESRVGVEALVRWQHPQRGLVPPDEFIRLAEARGLIVEIGEWVLRGACRQAARWVNNGAGGAPLHMAVNVSALQLAPSAGFVDCVAETLRDSGVDPASLVLEITESALMGNADSALDTLKELKALGVRLAIDDFGTGYSSLVHLKRFPVDILKVDRSFISGLGRHPEDSAIVASIIGLTHALGIVAVAEGVETPEQLAALQTLGCEFGQGYLWSRPLPSVELDQTPGMKPAAVPAPSPE
jgi:diguanylate cyclase (GGDEF)-like protein/PAS domain S-box-containing protein